MLIRDQYKLNKEAKYGSNCVCPSCGTAFVKQHHQQSFCRTKKGTVCKDKYWNTVTPEKRNNTSRISPASARWSSRQENIISNYTPDEDEHPFSGEALGQWND